MATGMMEAIASLKKSHVDAKSVLMSEIARANSNAEKVRALAQGLKEANQQVEAFLGQSGSNFPPEEVVVHLEPLRADINGVILNKG